MIKLSNDDSLGWKILSIGIINNDFLAEYVSETSKKLSSSLKNINDRTNLSDSFKSLTDSKINFLA